MVDRADVNNSFNFLVCHDTIFRYRLCLALIRMEDQQPHKEAKVGGIGDCIWCSHSCVRGRLQLTLNFFLLVLIIIIFPGSAFA